MTDYPIIVLLGISYFRELLFKTYNGFDPDKIRYRSIINRLLISCYFIRHPVFYARSRLSYIDDIYNDMYSLKLMTYHHRNLIIMLN